MHTNIRFVLILCSFRTYFLYYNDQQNATNELRNVVFIVSCVTAFSNFKLDNLTLSLVNQGRTLTD